MMENLSSLYEIYNPNDNHCPICTGLNGIYQSKAFQNKLLIPKELGEGYYQRLVIRPSMEVVATDISIYERITMGETQYRPIHNLAFCLGEPLHWHIEGEKEEYEIRKGECYLFGDRQGNSICTYEPRHQFKGFSIQMDDGTIEMLMAQEGKDNFLEKLKNKQKSFYKLTFSVRVTKIINEIMFCPYEGAIKRIYLEGKILELIAVYMSECIFEEEEKSGAGYNLSLSDISALHKVRELLDEHFIAAPTLKELSRKVCLNEYKLKIGFKELFGMPVHAYIIDKRLEMARYLIEEKKIRVTEAVQLVGYSDASHFAAKFKKKYGISPSWCLRNG